MSASAGHGLPGMRQGARKGRIPGARVRLRAARADPFSYLGGAGRVRLPGGLRSPRGWR